MEEERETEIVREREIDRKKECRRIQKRTEIDIVWLTKTTFLLSHCRCGTLFRIPVALNAPHPAPLFALDKVTLHLLC